METSRSAGGERAARLPVLTYHSLDDSGSPISTAPAYFARQMEALVKGGWRSLTLDQFLAGHRAGGWPRRSFLLTFDDGLVSFGELAVPALTRCGFTALVFVVAGRVGGTNQWPGQAAWAPKSRLMSWAELSEAARGGVEIGAHSVSHRDLASLPPGEAVREVRESRDTIEEKLGRPVRAFAYPYGNSTPGLVSLVAEEFDAGFGTRLDYATRASLRWDFPRLDAYYLHRRGTIASLDAFPVRTYIALRRGARIARATVAGGGSFRTNS